MLVIATLLLFCVLEVSATRLCLFILNINFFHENCNSVCNGFSGRIAV